MKKFFVILFVSLILFSRGTLALADNIPEPQGWVNDFAGVLSPADKEKITGVIQALEEKTSAAAKFGPCRQTACCRLFC